LLLLYLTTNVQYATEEGKTEMVMREVRTELLNKARKYFLCNVFGTVSSGLQTTTA